MRFKEKYKCLKRGIAYRSLYGKDADLCKKCFNKQANIINKGMPFIFDEPSDVPVQTLGFTVTKSQSDQIIQRLNYLFPNRGKKKKFSKIGMYLRLLVLADISSTEKSK